MIVDEINHKIFVKEIFGSLFDLGEDGMSGFESDVEREKRKLKKKRASRLRASVSLDQAMDSSGRLFLISFGILLGKKDKDR